MADRPLPSDAVRRYRVRRTAQVALPIAAIVSMIALLPVWIRPTLARTRIRTAVVAIGSIDAVITASGTVVPEIERVLSSQVDARVLRILKRPGAAVRTGEPVAELDLGEQRLAVDRLANSLRLTDNQQALARLALEKSLGELDGRIERKALDLQMLTEKADSAQRLFDEGGLVSRQAVRESRLAAQQIDIELAQMRREREQAQRTARLESDGLTLQRETLHKETTAAQRTLDLATTRSDRDGVLTWILSQEGALVRRGEVVARIADLSSFRVDASASDVHAGRIRTGVMVSVRVNDAALPGTISEVHPNVEDNVIRFTVALEEQSHALLRPNMQVDVLVITDRRPRALKVRQGPFLTGPDRGDVFVIRDGVARRTAVRFGLRSFDEVEITSGLREGDEVVISDMRDYAHLEEVEVR
jgi:HlyD family secretion protein